jgi:large subunit ribosomal protein L25
LEFIELSAKTRTTTGKSPARALRRQGELPAVLYGPDTEPVLLSVNIADLEKALKISAGQTFFNLSIADAKGSARTAMIKELQQNPVSQEIIHADFYEISMDRKITVKVPVVVTGKSIGVEMGGLLQIIRRELEVLCLPKAIPDTIEIDVTELNIGDSIHVEEIPLAEDVEIPAEVNFTVITILAPKVEEEEEPEEEGLEEGEEGAEEAAEAEEGETDES